MRSEERGPAIPVLGFYLLMAFEEQTRLKHPVRTFLRFLRFLIPYWDKALFIVLTILVGAPLAQVNGLIGKAMIDQVVLNTTDTVEFRLYLLGLLLLVSVVAGVDILNPVQTQAAGLNPARLQALFGGKVVFRGAGVETQTTLPLGSVDDIAREGRGCAEIPTPGGGFVFHPVHNVQKLVAPEKITAAFDTARSAGMQGQGERGRDNERRGGTPDDNRHGEKEIPG